MLFLLVKLPDGTMTVRRESDADAARLADGSRYMMFDGKDGVVVQDILNPDNYSNPDDYGRALKLLEDIARTVFVAKGKPTKSGMEVLGGLLREVHTHAEATERSKWTEEKAELLKEMATFLKEQKQLLEDYDEIGEEYDAVGAKLIAENEKLKRKHRRATLWVQRLVELLEGVPADVIVKRAVELGWEVKRSVPPENSNSQPASPATGEVNTPLVTDPKDVEGEK